MINNNDKGYILITSLLLLLVLTIVGLSAINTSTVENMLSGNIRLRESNISKAESGTEISSAIIERTVREMDTLNFSNIIIDLTLPNELRSTVFDPDGNTDTDVAFDSDPNNAGNDTTVDIDKMYSKSIEGCATQFASGYEGSGQGASSCTYTYYRINSSGAGLVSSTADVGAIYRYVPK